MKYLILFILLSVSTICMGQNHLFDNYEKQMNHSYGYNGPSYDIAIQGAFDILYKKFSRRQFNRKISFNANEWSNNVLKFLKVDYENMPLLNYPDLKADNLKVIGFTKTGEILQVIEYRVEWVKLERPGLGWQLRNYGDWYQIRTLDGEYAWIFTKPYGLNYAFASVIEKVIPKPIESSDKSDFPIGTILIIAVIVIFGIVVLVISFGSSKTKTSYGSGSYSPSSHTTEDSSSGSYSSSYISEDSSSGSYSSSYASEDSSNDESNGENNKRRCQDCQSIDLSGWGFTSKGNGRCKECDGTGHAKANEALVQFMTLGLEDDKIPCEKCSGTGQCQTCGGTGYEYY